MEYLSQIYNASVTVDNYQCETKLDEIFKD